ncbi:MAG: DUF1513 domain-containing protein [Proteobacteria bacterium]|nr:DUF1513 domain-containing protein [Pseudomonadota bacterium]MDA1070942.1 DUF1513 domain-containing protein [Pseudomonadota bacterium]
MAIDRRLLLAGLAAAPAVLLGVPGVRAATPQPRLLGAWQNADGGYGAGTPDRGLRVPLPDRGHDIAVAPDGRSAVVFGRRPGFFAAVIDLDEGALLATLESPQGRHFYGHGTYSADGTLIFATENAYETGKGRIAIYDVGAGYSRAGDWPSHGIGPHYLCLSLDGTALIAANGGVRTHPARDREKLNLDTMAPGVALIDARDGSLLALAEPPRDWHQLSTRHVWVAPDGLVAVGMQWEGDPFEMVPLVATWDGAGELMLCDEGEPANLALQGYTGAIAFDPTGTIIAATSPQGHSAGLWRREDLVPLASLAIPEVCGLCPGIEPGTVVMSSGLGGLWTVAADGTKHALDQARPASLWDNHLRWVA